MGTNRFMKKETYQPLINICRHPNAGLLWPFIIIVLIVFLVWTEDGSQNCKSKKCHNEAPKVLQSDTVNQAIDKIIANVRLNHNIVGWRRSMLIAICVSILILMLMKSRFPHGFMFFLIAAIIFTGVYFATAWSQDKWWRENDDKIEDSLIELRNKLNDNHTNISNQSNASNSSNVFNLSNLSNLSDNSNNKSKVYKKINICPR